MEGFSFICNINDLNKDGRAKFVINDVDIAVFKIKDEIFVVNNICPHQHASIIHEGFVENDYVVCPLHKWKFNLKNGKLNNRTKGLETYSVKIIDDKIYAKVTAKELNW